MGLSSSQLIKLAKEEFTGQEKLLISEEVFLKNILTGASTSFENKDNREIRGSLIRWIFSSKEVSMSINSRGINLQFASIKDGLDLEDLRITVPFMLESCVISGPLIMRDSIAQHVYLNNCELKGIKAERIQLNGSLWILYCKVFDGISTSNCRISGDVRITDSNIKPNTSYSAIELSTSVIGGSLEIIATKNLGVIDLSMLQLGGNLYLDKSINLNKNGTSLLAYQMISKGKLSFNDSKFNGEINLDNSEINGNVDFNNTTLGWKFDDKYGLSCSRISIKGSVSFYKALIQGSLYMGGAMMGDLKMTDCRLLAKPGNYALFAQNSRIKGNVVLNKSINNRKGFRSTGILNFQGALIDGEVDLKGAGIHNPGKETLNLSYAHIGKSILGNENFKSRGALNLRGIEVMGDIDLTGSIIINPGGKTIDLNGANLKGNLYLDNAYLSGQCILARANIQDHLHLHKVKVNNSNGIAIHGDGMVVNGTLFIKDARIAGQVRMINGHIGGSLECINSRFTPNQSESEFDSSYIFEGSFLNVGSQVIFGDNTVIEGMISFHAARIGKHFNFKSTLSGKGGVELSSARTDSIIWNPGEINENSRLYLIDTLTRKFHNVTNSWPRDGNFFLNGFKYESLGTLNDDNWSNTDWLLNRQDQLDFQPYEQLSKVLRDSGRDQQAKKVLIAKERVRRKGMKKVGRFWSWILDISIRYGFEPYRPLIIALVFLFIGVFVFAWGFSNELFITKEKSADIVNFNAFVYSLDVLVPIIDYGQKDAFIPKSDKSCNDLSLISCGAFLSAYYWFHITIGWVLSTLFVISFTSLVRKN